LCGQNTIYQKGLEQLIANLGFAIVNNDEDKHREGGKIFIFKLMDRPKYLRLPIKLSISAVDDKPCFAPLRKKFNTIVKIPKNPYKLLYPNLVDAIYNTNANVLTIEELCAEKIRALTTRGIGEDWLLILRDLVDLYIMDSNKILDKTLNEKHCILRKMNAVKGTSYWKKFKSFMNNTTELIINEEDKNIFIDQKLLDEKKLTLILNKIKDKLNAFDL